MDIQALPDASSHGNHPSSPATAAMSTPLSSQLAPEGMGYEQRQRSRAVVGVSDALATGTAAHVMRKTVEQGGNPVSRGRTGLEVGEECQAMENAREKEEEEEMDEKTMALVSEIERSLEEDQACGEGEEGLGGEPVMMHIHQHTGKRRVQFKEGEALTAEFDDANLWAHDPNEKAEDMIEAYKRECFAVKVKPIAKLLEQLERVDDLSIPIDTLDLKGVRLDNRSCEVLEAVLSRMQMSTLDLERSNLEDEGAIALCEMVEFYGCASKLVLANNNRLRPRAWLTIGRTLKKSPFLTMANVNYCNLEEQTLTLLLRSVRANCGLQVLKMEGNNLTGKGTFILMAAMKFNENLRELWLASNHLVAEDGQHLGSILRTNHTLRVLDVRDNNLQDAGIRYICAGIAEQQEGLQVLNISANNIAQEGVHHVSAMLPCTRSLRELNLSFNRCGDNGLFMLKLGLLANRSLEKLNLSNLKMTCEGAIALAEVLAESKHITQLDLKENDIRVAGLLALQLAHRMNHTLLFMETPKAYRVEPRDRSLIKTLLMEIDRYCARNLQEREDRAEAERMRQHEAQHAQLVGSQDELRTAGDVPGGEGDGERTSGEAEEEEAKEIDPSLIGSLDDVYPDDPGTMMPEDPFKRVPVMDHDHETASLKQMEKEMDALAVYGKEDSLTLQAIAEAEGSPEEDFSSLDSGVRSANLNPSAGATDMVGSLINSVQRQVVGGIEGRQQDGGSESSRSGNDDLLPDVVDGAAVLNHSPGQRGGLGRPEGGGGEHGSGTPPDIQLTGRGPSGAPDVASGAASSSPSPSQGRLPLDIAVGAQQSVDLLDHAAEGVRGESVEGGGRGSSRPMDLTDGLLANRSSHNS